MNFLLLFSLVFSTAVVGHVYGVSINSLTRTQILNTSILTTGRAGQVRTTACRWSSEVTKCVETAVAHFGGKSWCTFHLCGPSYVRAEECPEDRFQATHKCLVEQERRTVWKCEGSTVIKGLGLPLNCDGNCDSHVNVCPCSSFSKYHEKLTMIARAKAICHPNRK